MDRATLLNTLVPDDRAYRGCAGSCRLNPSSEHLSSGERKTLADAKRILEKRETRLAKQMSTFLSTHAQ